MGSLGGDSGEERNSGEVVMLGRRGGDQAFLGLCSFKDLHFPFAPIDSDLNVQHQLCFRSSPGQGTLLARGCTHCTSDIISDLYFT